MSKNKEKINLMLESIQKSAENIQKVWIAGKDKVIDLDWKEVERNINNKIMNKNCVKLSKSEMAKLTASISSGLQEKEAEFAQ